MKALKIAGVVIVVVTAILALSLVLGLPIGILTSAIQERVERDTGYRLNIAGSARLGLWPSLHAIVTDIKLTDPGDRDGSNRLTISRVRAEVSLSSLWSGHPQISELSIEKPVLYLPLVRERLRDVPGRSRAPAASGGDNPARIDRLSITDGAVILSNPRDRVEDRIEDIAVTAAMSVDNNVAITGSARAGDRPLTFDIKADQPSSAAGRQTIPAEFSLEMPGTLRRPLSGRAELRLSGKVVMINNLSGMLDDGAFNGWASVDVSSKPLVKLDLDLQRIEVGSDNVASNPAQGWSTALIDLRGLNYVDARAKLSVAALKVSGASLGPADVEASLAGGVLKATIGNLGAYGGQGSGEVIIDASSGNPVYAMHGDLAGARALPLLQNLIAFDKLDATMQGKLALRSSGASQQAIMSNLSGSAFLIFRDGAVRGINVAQMIRSLISNPLSGWQQSQDLSTDLTQLSASFQLERGLATTSDLSLVGPLVKVTGAGTIDLGNKALALRVEPKLVMTTEGQGRTSDPVGLGIPVVIDGSWAQPRFYPDMAGILDNPDAAYSKLKQMGQGLFGKDGAGLNNLINGIGGLIGNARSNGPTPPSAGSSAGNAPAAPNAPAGQAPPADLLGGQLGAAIGSLIQQGLQQQGTSSRGRALAPEGTRRVPGNAQDDVQDGSQDSQPMNDVLKRLFDR
jgi:AsmA protein